MPNAEKTEKVTVLKERIEGSDALLLAEFRGLSVHDATELRRSLAEQATFSVVKNTLMQRAAGAAGIEEMDPLLTGPTAVAFVRGDVVAVAKKVVDAAKRYPALILKGAYLDGKVLDGAAAQALATLESREAMLSRIAGLLKGEVSRAASMLQALQSRFVGVLEAYRDTFPPEATPAAEAASQAEASPEQAREGASSEARAGAPTEEQAEAEVEVEAGSGPGDAVSDGTAPSADEAGDDTPGAPDASHDAPRSDTTQEE